MPLGLLALMAGAQNAHFAPGWNGLARSPPLGWRSWNAFGGPQNNQPAITASVMRETIEAMVMKREGGLSLADIGFASVGVDEGWEQCTLPRMGNLTGCPLRNETSNLYCNTYCQNKSNFCTQHNAAGGIMISEGQFGGWAGMRALVEYGHSKNISMGFYMAGAPQAARPAPRGLLPPSTC